jgi:DNA-binding transcriptional LysR family regulator
MIAVRVGEDSRPTVVASPDYLLRRPRPRVPGDLQARNCIRLRFTSGAMYRWVFEKRGKSLEVNVTGSLITTDGDLAIRATLDGVGLARVPASLTESFIASKQLIPLLEDWTPPSAGFFLYYPSRRQMPTALQAFIDFVRARSRDGGGS